MSHFRRIWWLLAAVGLVAVAAAAALVAGGDGNERSAAGTAARNAATANLWVATTEGTAPGRCEKRCEFAAARAYGSFDAAYAAAHAGDLILVKAGAYGSQTIAKSTANGKTARSNKVTIRPSEGEKVTVAGFSTCASNIEYVDLVHAGVDLRIRAGRNVVLRNATAERWDIIYLADQCPDGQGDLTQHVTVVDGTFNLVDCEGDNHIVAPATDIRIISNTFIDHRTVEQCPGSHLDCVHTFTGISGMTFAGNVFDCDLMGFLMNGASNVLIENNFFRGTINSALQFRSETGLPETEVFDNVTVRFNTADDINLGGPTSNTLTNVTVQNNAVLEGISCRSGVFYGGNMSETSDQNTCSADDHPAQGAGNLLFASPSTTDFHIAAGSPAIGASFGTETPATDIDGESRPRTGADVGADERP